MTTREQMIDIFERLSPEYQQETLTWARIALTSEMPVEGLAEIPAAPREGPREVPAKNGE